MYSIYLLQRGSVKDDPSAKNKFSDNVSTDYMGAAEFEFGALPKSLREINSNIEKYHTISVPTIKRSGNPLLVWSAFPFQEIPEYVKQLNKIVEGKQHLKEASGLDKDSYLSKRTDFWWDLDNNVMFSFRPDIIKVIADSIRASIAWMDAQKANG